MFSMKILLIWPPWYRLQGSEFVGYPLGITSITAVLEKHGYDTKVYHADYEGKGAAMHTSELTQAYETYKKRLKDKNDPIWLEIKKTIEQQNPDIVGISVMTGSYGSSMITAQLVKDYARARNKQIPVIVGGAHPTVEAESILKQENIDFAVIGEGEYTFLELVQTLEAGNTDYSKIKGLAYKQGKRIIVNERRPLIENLDELPMPARHLILNIDKIEPDALGGIFSSRGCPFNCIFCSSKTIWGRSVRYRSVDNVMQEVEHVIDKYKAKHFFFVDDSFSVKKQRTLDLCNRFQALQKQGKDFTWHCQTRVDLLSDEVAKAFADSKCNCVLIGVETGYKDGLEKIKKAITLEQIMRATQLLKKHKIPVNAFFMIGFPWETMDEINSTINFMKEMDPDDASYAIVTPQPGTELHDIVKAEGLLSDDPDWSAFQHQSPDMFFSNKFNKQERQNIIEMAEAAFDAQKHKKLKQQALHNPLSTVKRVFKSGYYKRPKELLKLGKKALKS
ncbi:hypothetical protein CL614_05260 [archaeon]|nr:hypothetical protein [archaeon]